MEERRAVRSGRMRMGNARAELETRLSDKVAMAHHDE